MQLPAHLPSTPVEPGGRCDLICSCPVGYIADLVALPGVVVRIPVIVVGLGGWLLPVGVEFTLFVTRWCGLR